MDGRTLHLALESVAGIGMLAIGVVIGLEDGFGDLFAIGFLFLGVFSLGQTYAPLLAPDHFERPEIGRWRLAIAVGSVLLTGVVLVLVLTA
jgi:hypothetical protein